MTQPSPFAIPSSLISFSRALSSASSDEILRLNAGMFPSGPLSAVMRLAQLEELLQLGHLLGDRVGPEVAQLLELEVDGELGALLAGQHVRDLHRDGEVLLGEDLLEVVLVDVDRLALLERSRIGPTGVVADEEHLERELDLFLGVARRGLVRDVDALLGSD